MNKNILNDLNLSISQKNLKLTEFIDGISAKEHPVKPKKALIIAIGLATGLMFSICLVFFLEFLRKDSHE